MPGAPKYLYTPPQGTNIVRKFKDLGVILGTALLGIALIMPVAFGAGETFRDPTTYGSKFEAIMEQLRQHHVNPDAVGTDEELFKIAIDAMMKAIGDRHGTYLTPDGHEALKADLAPENYSGVGIKIAKGSGGLVILEIFRRSGLKLMGVKVGDTITRAYSSGGTDVTWDGKNVKELVQAIKGPAGTDVTLALKRGTTVLGEVTVQRVNTRNQYVYMSKSEAGILTIRITSFSNTIYDDIKEQLEENGWLRENGELNTDIIKAVAIDLRSNPGGSLRSAHQTGDIILPKDLTVVRVIQPPNEESDGRPVAIDFKTDKRRLIPNTIPRVVLVNGLSASASEIVAGAAKRHKEMPIFGTKTYGKGSVQTVLPLEGGGAIKTTTAIYLAGGDLEIDGKGIEPDNLIRQPDAPGISVDHKRLNGNIIRKSMDPDMDYQLRVAHTYLTLFLTGGHSLDSGDSVQSAIGKAGSAPQIKWNKALCDERGLRGCPASPNPTVMGTAVTP